MGEELEVVQVHIAVDRFLTALEAAFPGKTEEVEVMDYAGRDEALAHLCFACAEMLSARTPGKCRRIADLAQLLASYLVEKYVASAAVAATSKIPGFRRLHFVLGRAMPHGHAVSGANKTTTKGIDSMKISQGNDRLWFNMLMHKPMKTKFHETFTLSCSLYVFPFPGFSLC